MILLLSNASTRKRLPQDSPVGDFVQPRSRILVGKTDTWAADNDAFKAFNQERYEKMLQKIHDAVWAGEAPPPRFIAMPDVVGDHRKTVQLFGTWHRVLGNMGLRRAFVLQDGATYTSVPWEYFEAVFIGGTTEFKLGPVARKLVMIAKGSDKWVHMGRVNSIQRLEYARSIGCDSCDGSSMARFCDQVVPPMIESLKQLHLFTPNPLNP